jgi:protein O-GlcNAc transferase
MKHEAAMVSIREVMDLLGRGRLDEAESRCRTILTSDPQNFDALSILGWTKIRQQAPLEARRLFEQAVSARPASAEAFANLAFVMLMLNVPAEALVTSARALALDPNHAGALLTRGNALFRFNRLDESLASYDKALKIAGDNIEALIGRGTVLAALKRLNEALATFDRIPVAQSPLILRKRADLLRTLGFLPAAARDYRQLTNFPDLALSGWVSLTMCAQETCDWAALAEPQAKVLGAVDAGQTVEPLGVLQIGGTAAQHLKCAQGYAPRVMPSPLPASSARKRPPRLRIAYLSPDFRSQTPVAYLLPGLLEGHDRRRFEVIGVSLRPTDDSDISARIFKTFDQFYDLQAHSDTDAVALLRQAKIDIAIDLAGYTRNARPAILARRVAPIQANYLGYCGTSGSNFIDYFLIDRIVVPPEEQQFFTEKLVYLPDSFMVTDAAQPVANAPLSRSECGLPNDGFVFCCFSVNYKITRSLFDVWLRLLRQVDGSVLWLSSHLDRGRENLQRYTEAQGIDSQRLVFAPGIADRAHHLARHRLADVFLDTIPYNAHSTASDALFVGLPVLTVMGTTCVGRVAASVLHAIGLDELVTRNLEEYEALALGLAQDPARLRALRAKLAVNQKTHPLFNTNRFRQNIERAYDQMFQIYCRGEASRSFSVPAGQPCGPTF